MEKFTNELEASFRTWRDSAAVKEALAAVEKATDGETGTFEVVITTENIDRYQEMILIDGWDTNNYMANPVVLWGHDHDQLIGVCTSLTVSDGKMIARGKFAPTEAGQEKRKLYELGFLRATSVGFIEKERQGNVITKAELLEFSFVSVPANPYALSLALEKGLSIDELVTKGFMNIKTVDQEGEVTDTVAADEEVVDEPVEKKFAYKSINPIVAQLRAAADALEALSDEEPERIEEAEEVVADEPNTEKDFDTFQVVKFIQSLDSEIGDFLAARRQARKG